MPIKSSSTALVTKVVVCFSIILLLSVQTSRRSSAALDASQDLSLPSTLARDVTVCTPEGGTYKDIASVTLTPKTGQTIFLEAKTTAKRVPCPEPRPSDGGCANSPSTSSNLLAGTRINCSGVTVVTTRNHRGTDNASDNRGMVQFATLLYHPKASEIDHPVTCKLQVLGGFGGKGCLKYLGNVSTATFLNAFLRKGGSAWGTSFDGTNAADNNGKRVTFIGRGFAPITADYPTGEEPPDLGPSEFVLNGRRFNADRQAISLNVFSDVQLTCESNSTPCGVTAVLFVQQVNFPTDKVCSTTQVSQSILIDKNSHHQKLHLKRLNVPFNPSCTGRSFIIKTHVRLGIPSLPFINGGPIVVEYGNPGGLLPLRYSDGRSITIVVQNFPVNQLQHKIRRG